MKTNVIAPQDFDTAASNYHSSEATVIVDQAIVHRLEALEAFKRVTAPFDGIVTARNTDIGAYVPLGSGTQIFRMARISPLRVYVDTPEAFAPLIHAGDQADLTVNQFPARKFAAHVVTTSGAINPTSKRLLTELQVPNETGELPPSNVSRICSIGRSSPQRILTSPRTLFTRTRRRWSLTRRT